MSNPAVTPTFTESDESWSVESTLLVFDSRQILDNSENVFQNYDVTKVDIFHLGHQVRISVLTSLLCICIECVIKLCFFYKLPST